ncbi:heterokaryon incompatibility protein-domain-containing protein [Dendryphion nanum]|uniref:Heterokaryon incompatibility protein-domain-containing protein n=1 Tax=Dendryphion nanum TaxID=256645 RepID=A0A9P9DIC5_9PLEO|nr:heterokaryon incompatibility protein-domain-containing protein [Dendryphion nanum]
MYKPLPNDTSIRILSFQPSSSTSSKSPSQPTISCTVTNIDLNNDPVSPYTCLSYTWGSPFPPSHSSSSRYAFSTSGPKILVDGHEMGITQSLYEFLHQFWHSDPSKLSSIWIDSICIDQRNPEGTAERGKQVAMMDRVYATATDVLIWLGPEDDSEKILQAGETIFTLQALAKIPIDTFQKAVFVSGVPSILEPSTYGALGISEITHKSWVRLRSFYERTWFSRAWVTQEASLASSLTVQVGSYSLLWSDLYQATFYIFHLRAFISESYAPPGLIARLTDPDPVLKPTELTAMAWSSLISINRLRQDDASTRDKFVQRDVPFHISDQPSMTVTTQYIGNPEAWRSLNTHVFHKNRRKRATDLRDKIYAWLGLLRGMSDSTGKALIIPDYTPANPVEKLYTEVTRKMYTEFSKAVFGSIHRIPLIEDRSLRQLKDLPSWVPDLSVGQLPQGILGLGFNTFRASGQLEGGFIELPSDYEHILGIWGVRIDTIVKLGESYEEIKEGLSIRRCLEILEDVQTPTNEEKGHILCRTLMAGRTIRFEQPPEEEKEMVRGYLTILKAAELLEEERVLGVVAHANGTTASNIESGQIDPSNWQEFDILEEGWKPLPEEIISTLSQLRTHKLDPSAPLPKVLQSHIALTSLDVESLESRLEERYTFRRLFLTASGRIGIAPSSTQLGDVLWLIPPEKVFHVFRKVQRFGGAEEWEVLGDAYLHGGMYGGAAVDGGEGKRDVVYEACYLV